MSKGIELIKEEREKQIGKHGYSAGHDVFYMNKELLYAALAYLKLAIGEENTMISSYAIEDWPWDAKYFKNEGYIESLKKAGALIAAELDRLELQ